MRTFNFSCFIFYLVMLAGTCPVMGQVLKKQLTEADYKLWSTMEVQQLSDAGNWASYSLLYESGFDTLFVRHTKTLKAYALPKGSNGQFVKEKWFVCQDASGHLRLINLVDGKQTTLKEVTSYVISHDARFLIVHRKTDDSQELLAMDLNDNSKQIIPNVSNFSYNAKANALICDSNRKPVLVFFDKVLKINKIDTGIESEFLDYVWQKNGESVAFLYGENVFNVGYYKLKRKRFYSFEPSLFLSFPSGAEVYNSSFTALTISDDGSKIFFGVKPKEIRDTDTGVQVWNTADKSLYPEKKLIKEWKAVPKLAVWFPEDSRFRMLTDNEFPKAMLTGDQKFALLFNPIANEPQFDYNAPIDFYLCDLVTGDKHLILKNQSSDETKLSVSGNGRYVTYFKDSDWWIYDIRTNKHRNLTKVIGVSFEREDYNWSGEIQACGIAGWTADDEALIIYDSYDVWLVKADGSGFERLTYGRETKTKYRVVPRFEANFTAINFNWMKKGIFQLSEGLLFHVKNDSKNGYFIWDRVRGQQELVFVKDRVGAIKLSKIDNVYIYVTEHYHNPPQLFIQIKKDKPKLLFESNSHQKKFQWGFSKLIRYTNSKGKLLKGALFYPAGYVPEKKYPMVVQIYERLSDNYNKYVNPSVLNSVGFNISNFTSNGYFVLLPDIEKEEGDTGKSAVDCVVSAVDKVLANESVDAKRIGLIGHSFGGYQTNFIITQTNIFATAVSSAGASDVISDYLYVAWNISKPNGFRYEFQQASFGVSPFDDYERYLKNSPVSYAKHVETPLLLWSGEEDKQVHYFQSLEFHLALRRLRKPNILLLYEGERHTIVKKTNQIDLTHRIQEWFDYYLKGKQMPDWFVTDKI